MNPHRKAWRVLAWEPRRRVWEVVAHRDSHDDACELAEAMQHRDPRCCVRIMPVLRPVLTVVPPINNAARSFRQEQAALMSDRADTNKRYKSPG